MADNHCVYKECLKEVADQMDISVTFMAKYSEKQAGSSCHVHLSLWEKNKNAFTGKKSLGPVDSPIERINKRVRMQMLLRADRRNALRWVLRHLRRAFGPRGRGANETQARVDVDPYSLL